MSKCTCPPKNEPAAGPPSLPVETEIYILPTGEIVVADLPAELAALLATKSPGPPDGQDERGATP